MAWICVDLDETLIDKQPLSSLADGEDQTLEDAPVEGAVEAMQQLAEEGHRLTVFTDRFAALPASEKQRVKEEIEQHLLEFGFPEMEVWTGTFKPAADIYLGKRDVTYDDDWGLALAQIQQMLEDRGAVPGPQPGAAEQQLMNEPAEEPVEEE
jgi:hypothetical protein